MQEMEYDSKHISRLSKRFKAKIAEALEFVVVNGDTESSYPGTANSSTSLFKSIWLFEISI
jgi:cysteine sulfinate desulfinase/cysteine desulfurase-like protein